MVWDAATCCGTLNYKLDEPTSFFFALSISFLLVPIALPCGVVACLPVHVLSKEIYLSSLSPSTCVEQIAWPGNRFVKCAMRYKFGRKCRMHCDQTWSTWLQYLMPCWSWMKVIKDNIVEWTSKNRLGCRNLPRHFQLPTWWTHIFFFYRSPVVSSAVWN